MDYKLSKGAIENLVLERQTVGRCLLDNHSRESRSGGFNERLRWVHCQDGRRPQALYQLTGEGTGTTTDIKRGLPGSDLG